MLNSRFWWNSDPDLTSSVHYFSMCLHDGCRIGGTRTRCFVKQCKSNPFRGSRICTHVGMGRMNENRAPPKLSKGGSASEKSAYSMLGAFGEKHGHPLRPGQRSRPLVLPHRSASRTLLSSFILVCLVCFVSRSSPAIPAVRSSRLFSDAQSSRWDLRARSLEEDTFGEIFSSKSTPNAIWSVTDWLTGKILIHSWKTFNWLSRMTKWFRLLCCQV